MARGQLEALEGLQGEKEEALFKRDYTILKHVVEDLLGDRKVDQTSHNKLSRAVLQASIDLDQKQIDAYQGEPVPESLDDEKDTITARTPEPEPMDLGPLLSEFIERFPTTKPTWSKAAHDAYWSATKVLIKILGDIQVGTITRGIMNNYREILAKIPPYWTNRHQHIKVEDLPAPGLPTISRSKFNNNLIYVGQLMRYAVDCGYLDADPMPLSRMNLPDKRPGVHMFNDDQVLTILEATSKYNDHRYWLPLLGLYTAKKGLASILPPLK